MDSKPTCPVCLEDLDSESIIVIAGECKHLLCLECAVGHYIVHQGGSCPYCRQISRTMLITTTTVTQQQVTTTRPIYISSTHDWYVDDMLTQCDTTAIINRLIWMYGVDFDIIVHPILISSDQ